jgi:hypothetical protein
MALPQMTHFLLDGNPHKIPRMGTLSGIGHPPFSYPFHDGNIIGHTRGPGPASLNSGYGSTHRSINCGVPFWKGIGLFLAGRSGSGMERSNAAGSSEIEEFAGGDRVDQGSAVPNSFTSQI